MGLIRLLLLGFLLGFPLGSDGRSSKAAYATCRNGSQPGASLGDQVFEDLSSELQYNFLGLLNIILDADRVKGGLDADFKDGASAKSSPERGWQNILQRVLKESYSRIQLNHTETDITL